MPFRYSRIKQLWEDENFIADVQDLIRHVLESDKTAEETITWVANAYPEDEQGLIAVYFLGMASIGLTMIESLPEGEGHESKPEKEESRDVDSTEVTDTKNQGKKKRGKKVNEGDMGT